MRQIKLYIVLLVFGLLAGCFEDEGNYSYEEINPPVWFAEYNDVSPKNIYGYAGEGEVMTFKGSSMFKWEGDSATRANEVRYEWKIGDVVIGDQLDFEIPTDELVKKINLKYYSNDKGEWGTFNIIEKETEITFPARLYVWIYPTFALNDWYILSEDNGNSKLSVIRRRSMTEQGQTVSSYELKDNAFESINKQKIPGKPIDLAMETSRDVSPSGACVILTDQVAYEVNLQNMEKVGEVKDQFLDGTPANFNVADLREKAPRSSDEGACTFVATKDGRVFTRMKSPNYLGGQYLTEPYYIDSKEYKITKFGHTLYGGLIPCYDEKNRRVVMATTWREDINHGGGQGDYTSVYRTKMTPLNTSYGAPVDGFPEGTEMLYITAKNHISWGYGGLTLLFTVYYNDPTMDASKTLVGDFSFNNQSQTVTSFGFERWFYLPVKLDESSVILVSGNNRYKSEKYAEEAKYRDFYTVDNKLYYVQRGKDYYDKTVRFVEFNATFNSKITSLAYAYYNFDQLWVGCEDGSIYGYDIRNINEPKLVCEKKLNGKIVSMKQIGWHTGNHDWY